PLPPGALDHSISNNTELVSGPGRPSPVAGSVPSPWGRSNRESIGPSADKKCSWPSGPDTGLPCRSGGFDCRPALSLALGWSWRASLSNRRDGFDSRTGRSDTTDTPVAQRRRHLPYKERIIAGSSPAGVL